MNKIFQTVPKPRIQRSTFDLSHSRKLSGNLGELIPVMVQEVVPGDKFDIETQSMVRLAPLIAPVMHRMNVTIHYFFVPNRIIWDLWEEFITGTKGLVVPTGNFTGAWAGKLSDHLGLPSQRIDNAEVEVSTLAHRAYLKIWEDYYRDANLMDEIDWEHINDDDLLNMDLKVRCWEKDYFTSALPNPQTGLAAKVPATVSYKTPIAWTTNGQVLSENENIALGRNNPAMYNSRELKNATQSGVSGSLRIENIDSINVEVEELRKATKLQRFLERSMRAGNRYAESLLAHWGVNSKDARLQRPEYLGGGRSPVVISDVANTTGTLDAPQGSLSGNGLSVGTANKASKYVEEHGYIMGILSVLPETAYYQGIPRMFDRKLQLDYYFPEFAQLGEQPIKRQELYLSDDAEINESTFGYQSRYAEYKYNQSTVHGKFRTDLQFWHMARAFGSAPALNEDFLEATKIDGDIQDPWRIFAVSNSESEQLWIQLFHKVRATRPMPFLNDPTL